ncbi:MAG: hypothetical protein QXV75_08615 [Candidatus Bathyarchaeia archaeon]
MKTKPSSNQQDINQLMGVLKRFMLKEGVSVDYNTRAGIVLYVYLIKDCRVIYRLDFHIPDISYKLVIGMCKKAIKGELKPVDEGYPYPVWRQRVRVFNTGENTLKTGKGVN